MATRAIELVWAFAEPAIGPARHHAARGIDSVLSLTVDVEECGDGETTVDLRAPIMAHVTAAIRRGATVDPSRPSSTGPNRAPALAQLFSTLATITVRPRGQWIHLKVTLPNGVADPVVAPVTPHDAGMRIADAECVTILVAALRDGAPIHVRSSLPTMAGLPGGTYERPSLTLGTALARPSLGTAV